MSLCVKGLVYIALAAFGCLIAGAVLAVGVQVGDAYARGGADGSTWIIGTDAVQVTFECKNSGLSMVSYRNKLTNPPTEYVDAKSAAPPFKADSGSGYGGFTVQSVWTKLITGGITVDPATDGVKLAVKKGDLIGFSVGAHQGYECDETHWIITLDYGDGESCVSSSDAKLDQGPMWYYYGRKPGTGVLMQLESLEQHEHAGELVRFPSKSSNLISPDRCPFIGVTKTHPSGMLDAVRVWKAPRDGIVAIGGQAKNVGCGGDVDVSILRLVENEVDQEATAGSAWTLTNGNVGQVAVGGCPAVQLDLTLNCDSLRAYLHVQAYPGTSVLRQWVEVENTSSSPTAVSASAMSFVLSGEDATSFTNYWMVGGNSKADQGMMHSAHVSSSYHNVLLGQATTNFMPWMALKRTVAPGDGWFCALECLAPWRLAVDYDSPGPASVTADVTELNSLEIAPGKKIRLPIVTIGVFAGDLDDMAQRSYDWQYQYLWDYTNMDYYARTKWAVPWVFCARNLQEQFTHRLAGLDMDADLMRTVGFDMLWDDAGWSTFPGWPDDSYGNVFKNTYEGPDFSHTLRYLGKMGMNWLLWFAGRPSTGVMDTKVASWGDFEWRTDAVGFPDMASDSDLRAKATQFLDTHPRCSFHTCSGGSTYSHTFEIQRLANTNYFSDFGRGLQTNYYFSYMEPPDKWLDIIEPWGTAGAYKPETARMQLTMVPFWGLSATRNDQEMLRRDLELYRYLLREGVAGRWSHMFHPGIEGDQEFYYSQRTNYDHTKACIILKHKAPGEVTIYPRMLKPNHGYVVGFDSTRETATRTGSDLMKNGITIKNQSPGELVFLNLPNRPRSGADRVAPKAPGDVYARIETNIGHSGVGVYWSPGADNNWVSFYEVKRGDRIIGKAGTGNYYFDRLEGWNPDHVYSVRTVDGDGNVSGWVSARRYKDEPLTYHSLGGHFPVQGRGGWSAETRSDAGVYAPMAWVPPAKNPAGDLGGTPNQRGGIEGYWEGPGGAQLGRGWQRASSEAACVRTWTAPRAGKVQITGRVMKEWYHQDKGAPLRVKMLHNEKQVWPTSGWAEVPLRDLVGITHDLSLDVAPKDTVRFILDRGAASDDDLIAWMPCIVYSQDHIQYGGSVVRILCGSKRPYKDQNGNMWSQDRFCSGGGSVRVSDAQIHEPAPTDNDSALYQFGRKGKDFTYSIPVGPGLYSVRLKFAETEYQWSFQRPINLEINGREVLRNFDICQAARGPRRAFEKVFKHVAPDADGRLILRFTGGWEPTQKTHEAMVQAIEVLPEIRPTIRINAGSDAPFVDWNSFVWVADEPSERCSIIRSDAPVSQASPTTYDQALYQTAKSGREISYHLPASPGLYSVHLKFAELWLKEPGKRPMNIEINGKLVRESWDPGEAAGQINMAADIRARDIAPDKDGRITIRVTAAGANDAILQGIEIE